MTWLGWLELAAKQTRLVGYRNSNLKPKTFLSTGREDARRKNEIRAPRYTMVLLIVVISEIIG